MRRVEGAISLPQRVRRPSIDVTIAETVGGLKVSTLSDTVVARGRVFV